MAGTATKPGPTLVPAPPHTPRNGAPSHLRGEHPTIAYYTQRGISWTTTSGVATYTSDNDVVRELGDEWGALTRSRKRSGWPGLSKVPFGG